MEVFLGSLKEIGWILRGNKPGGQVGGVEGEPQGFYRGMRWNRAKNEPIPHPFPLKTP